MTQKPKKADKVDETEPDRYLKAFSMFLKLITININRIHIRFEDDYFSGDAPYSFGVIVRQFQVFNYEKDIIFANPTSVSYEEVSPSDPMDLSIKKIKVNDVRVYWNSKSETYIPYSLK